MFSNTAGNSLGTNSGNAFGAASGLASSGSPSGFGHISSVSLGSVSSPALPRLSPSSPRQIFGTGSDEARILQKEKELRERADDLTRRERELKEKADDLDERVAMLEKEQERKEMEIWTPVPKDSEVEGLSARVKALERSLTEARREVIAYALL